MRIYRGKIVSKRFVPTLLEAIPEEDLEELKSIHVKLKCMDEGGIHRGRASGMHRASKHRIEIYAQIKLFHAEKTFSVTHDDFYGLFARDFAETLYHEVGHHVDQLRNSDYLWFKTDYDPDERNESYHMIEAFANQYKEKIIPIAEEMQLYDKLNPGDMPYAYAMFRKHIHGCIRRFKAGKYADGGWNGLNAVLNYLRKQKLGPEAKYNVPQLFNKTFDELKYYMLEDNCKRRFRRFAVRCVDPLWYISRGNLHYPYFTEDHLEAIISLKDSFNREIGENWDIVSAISKREGDPDE